MTYRIYARWKGQRVSDKVTTDSLCDAEDAYDELVNRVWDKLPIGIAFTQDGQSVKYFDFTDKSFMDVKPK